MKEKSLRKNTGNTLNNSQSWKIKTKSCYDRTKNSNPLKHKHTSTLVPDPKKITSNY